MGFFNKRTLSISEYKRCFMAFVLLIMLSPMVFAANTGSDVYDHSHALWDKVLMTSVVDVGPASRVRYLSIKQNPQQLLQYLSDVSTVTQGQYNAWNSAQKLAFLINAYNAFTVKLVIDHYPVTSIKDTGSWFSSPWKKKFFTLLGQKRHLDNIEHDMIRGHKDFAEPRIHFALVCASVGCPKLQTRAFTETRLESMLEEGSRAFLNDATRNRFSMAGQALELSKIFDWYGDDFIAHGGSVEAFVARYMVLNETARSLISAKRIGKVFLDYDWSLNDAGNAK